MEKLKKCGYIAIIGRPNVGKSTLLNRILGQKLSITSRKPQTTRHRIHGVKTVKDIQWVYVDTPGLHQKEKHLLNKFMNRAVKSAIRDVDVIVFMIDSRGRVPDDQFVFEALKEVKVPIIFVLNKVDKIKLKETMLPELEKAQQETLFKDVIPISAHKGDNVEKLEKLIADYLPEGAHLFPAEQITDRPDRFLCSEIIREKLMRQLGDELPYALTVQIEDFKEEKEINRINATIFVERDGQKAIVIGEGGNVLKEVGTKARKDMEKMFEKKVFLKLWVKVKGGWSDDERSLKSLGY